MRHLDLSFEGRRLSDRDQPDNGTRPHGGYRGSKRHPMCHFSHDKGKEFHHKMEEEIERLIMNNELALHGTSPSWSLAVHREPSYTDESPLMTNQYLASSKVVPANGVTLQNRPSLLPPKKGFKPQKRESTQFYRPNSTHQYLSATELKNASERDVNMLYGRPTRTTLLRARQRCTSAPTNQQVKRRESDPKIDEYRSCYSVPSNTENLQLDKDGETLHSFLTGARYNRAHCLDARSVDHTGVYMPRNNTAMGCFFTGPKGHEYLKEFEETTPRSESMPSPRFPPPTSPKRRRPTTAPGHGNRSHRSPMPFTSPPSPPRTQRHAWALTANTGASPRYRTLNVVGCRLPLGMSRDMALRLPNLQPIPSTRKPLEETYRGHQPPPTPTSYQQTSQGAPTDRRFETEGADPMPEFENLKKTEGEAEVSSLPVTQVVVKNNGGDDEKTTMAMKEEVVDDVVEVKKEEEIVEEERKDEEKVEEEVKEDEKEEEEGGEKIEEVVEGDLMEEEKKEEEKGVEEEEKKEDEEVVENDNVVDGEENAEEVEVVEDGDKEEEVEDYKGGALEDEGGEEKKNQKEVTFFITEKDGKEGVEENGDVVNDEVENGGEVEEGGETEVAVESEEVLEDGGGIVEEVDQEES